MFHKYLVKTKVGKKIKLKLFQLTVLQLSFLNETVSQYGR